MNSTPSCILYTCDEELVTRMTRISQDFLTLHPFARQAEVEQWISQFGETILLADIRAPNCLELLSALKQKNPMMVRIPMGEVRSDPMLAAETLEPFASMSLQPDVRELKILLRQAKECLSLRKKNRLLANELTTLNARQPIHPKETRTSLTTPLQNFLKAQRNVDNLSMLFESVVDGLVATARVSRAGIFMHTETQQGYAFQTGTRCLSTTENLFFHEGDPFIRWMEASTHLISRTTLQNVHDLEERAMLKGLLDGFGAEIIIPLYATGMIKGWIFVGQRSTGVPFEIADLEEFTTLADHISTTLEKAFQYEETALQKALAETLLHSIPFGIIACDENVTIRWFNSTARNILEPEKVEVIGCRAEELGSRIADLLRRTLGTRAQQGPLEWNDPQTKRTLRAESRCLLDNGNCVGAMMMLHDVTGVKLLQEKEDQVERATFWNALASSMSHEIRNPLVAIKTFAQLLPERYEDPDFRSDFSKQVTAEIDKLNLIIDKINQFANPSKPVFKYLDIRNPIELALTRIRSEFKHDNLDIQLSADDSDLHVSGDSGSLEECMYHLLRNSVENLGNKPDSRISVTVKGQSTQCGEGNVHVMITDNGCGIAPLLLDKVYSPFSTTKARGLGLGLPIAKRAIIDHNGQMDIETDNEGTTINITIPSSCA